MSSITIRYATIDDAALIAAISRQTFADTFEASNTVENMQIFMQEKFSAEILKNEVGLPSNIFLLAYDGDEPVGYVKMRQGDPPAQLNGFRSIEIARIYATKNSIGKGVGKSLMQNCISIGSEKNMQVIWLGVWEKNERAIAFYEKWGFEKFSTHIFMLGNDPQTDWLMKKHLV